MLLRGHLRYAAGPEGGRGFGARSGRHRVQRRGRRSEDQDHAHHEQDAPLPSRVQRHTSEYASQCDGRTAASAERVVRPAHHASGDDLRLPGRDHSGPGTKLGQVRTPDLHIGTDRNERRFKVSCRWQIQISQDELRSGRDTARFVLRVRLPVVAQFPGCRGRKDVPSSPGRRHVLGTAVRGRPPPHPAGTVPKVRAPAPWTEPSPPPSRRPPFGGRRPTRSAAVPSPPADCAPTSRIRPGAPR